MALLLPGAIASAAPSASAEPLSSPQIAGNVRVKCVLSTEATVWCWGDNEFGSLGNGTVTDSATPVAVTGMTDVRHISAGWTSCAVLASGQVACWGMNEYGGLGTGNATGPEICGGKPCSTTPVLVAGISNAVSVASFALGGCAVLGDGSVKCWGWNGYGNLGNGTTEHSSTPVAVAGVSNAVAVTTDGRHSCALLADTTVACWGFNGFGGLGFDSSAGLESCSTTSCTVPVPVPGLSNVASLSSGDDFTCALVNDGTAQCWGRNDIGQLGNGTTALASESPSAVVGLTNAAAISSSLSTTCALLDDGALQCWGSNSFGALGDGTVTHSDTPVAVVGITNAVAVAAGMTSCALLSDGRTQCWGQNERGSLGVGSFTGPEDCSITSVVHWCSRTPVTVTDFEWDAPPPTTTTTTSASTTTTTVPAPPDIVRPTAQIVGLPTVTLSTKIIVGVSARDNAGGSGLKNVDIQSRIAPWNGSFGAWTNWKSATTASSATYTTTRGRTVCFRVRARDHAANVSSYSAASCSTVPLLADQAAYSSGWTKKVMSTVYGGAQMSTKTKGKTMIRTTAKGKRLFLVVTKCASCGTVQVRFNGIAIANVDLRSSTTKYKQIVQIANWSTIRTGTLQATVTSSTGKTVALEGIAIYQS